MQFVEARDVTFPISDSKAEGCLENHVWTRRRCYAIKTLHYN